MMHSPPAHVLLFCAISGCALGQDDPAMTPATAPGQPFAYVSQGLDLRDDVFLLSADGKVDSNLTRSGGYDSWPSWSPDGLKIAFESERATLGASDIFVLTLDGSVATARITFDTVHSDVQPAWSPLGNRIAFVSSRDSAGFDIYLMDVDGGNVTRLTTDAEHSVQPAWSPDGSKLAFASNRTGSGEVFVMDTLGGNVVNLTNAAGEDLTPAWSPDGQRIAFMSNRGATGSAYAIWVMNADGGNPVKISPSAPPCELPHWQPGGQRVIYDCDGDIFMVNPDGTNRVQITHTGNTQRSEVMARWKP